MALAPFLFYVCVGIILHQRNSRTLEVHDMVRVPLTPTHGRRLASASASTSRRALQQQYEEIPWSPPDQIPVTNVPSDFSRLTRTEWYTQGPVNPANILESAPASVQGGECLTIGEALKAIGATRYYKLLQDAGLRNVILDPKDVQATLLVPTDQSFFDAIDAAPLREENSIDELIYYAPELKKPLAGASILKGLWPSDSFGNGMRIPTSNWLGMKLLHATIEELDEMDQDNRRLKAVTAENGNTVDFVVMDIVTCGPSIIHVVDSVLLPFSFDAEPMDVTDLI